ncbi:MAG: M42 family metallopeptidase [Clostridia bacterium]|nr:M42 family metallopeptidase [Clostridia bacterium]MBP3360231.1 M42 family metallopeptidase [Clostridia bacterium]
MELLKKLTACDAPSGNEEKITELIRAEVEGYADEIYTDALGNLVARKKGSGKRVMLAAHCDEIGVVVTFIDEKGFLRFSDVGGLYLRNLINRKVRFENGTIGVIGTEEENEKRAMSKMYIDIGAASREEAEKLVSIGDMAAFVGDFYVQNGRVISKALDNRAGCYVLIETLKNVKSDNDLYFVFTTQEEVGLRGARTAAYAIKPEYALSVDITDTGDTPKAPKMAVRLGEGAAVKVMDYSVITSREVRESLVSLAKDNGIKYQLEIMTDGGTDAGVIHFTGEGVKTGGISIPTRYIHSPSEMISVDDLNACVQLAKLFAENI